MWETIRGYLTFTRKERLGVLFLLVLISVLFVLPFFFRTAVGDPDPEGYKKMKDGIRKFESCQKDSSSEAVIGNRYPNPGLPAAVNNSVYTPVKERTELFYFDPNALTANDWHRLGLSERLAKTILHYIEKGGRFRRAEDLKKLYGLSRSDYERLSPYVQIAKPFRASRPVPGFYTRTRYIMQTLEKADSIYRRTSLKNTPGMSFPHNNKKLHSTDINLADSSDWASLPGIGEKLASRIVHFRDKLGGFYRAEQIGETFGLPDSSFQRIKPCLLCSSALFRRINLNSATIEELRAHPYIRWQLAKIIIDYRQQHGGFHSPDELLQLARMEPLQYEKLKPYLTVGP
jgi:competence protein ComEA